MRPVPFGNLGSLLLPGTVLVTAALVIAGPGATDMSGSPTWRGCVSSAPAHGCGQTDGLARAHDVAVSPDGRSLYVAAKTGGVNVFRRDARTGAVRKTGCVDGTCPRGRSFDGAAGVVVAPDGRHVYVSFDAAGAIVAYRRDHDGALRETACVASTRTPGCDPAPGLEGVTGLAVAPDGRNLYAVSELADALVTFARAGDGRLVFAGCVAARGAAGCERAPGLDHATGVTVSRDGGAIYVTSIESDAVSAFRRNANGRLTALGCVAQDGAGGCARGHGLRGANGVAVSADGDDVYVASEIGGAVAALARDRSGALRFRGCLSGSGADGCTTAAGLSGAARVELSPDGRALFVGGFRGDTLTSLRRKSDGSLTRGPCLGDRRNQDGCHFVGPLRGPAGMALSPDGRHLYVTALRSNALSAFALAPAG